MYPQQFSAPPAPPKNDIGKFMEDNKIIIGLVVLAMVWYFMIRKPKKKKDDDESE